MRAIRGHPNRGLRDLSSTMARMSASLGPFGPGFFGTDSTSTGGGTSGAPAPGETPEVSWGARRSRPCGSVPDTGRSTRVRTTHARRQIRRTLPRTTEHDELLPEQEILRDDRAHSAGATELCGRDEEVEQGDHNSRHTRASVGHTAGKAQPRSGPDSQENWEFETHRPNHVEQRRMPIAKMPRADVADPLSSISCSQPLCIQRLGAQISNTIKTSETTQ